MAEKGLSCFKRFVFSKGFILVSRLIIADIFVYSGTEKFLNIHAFAQSVSNYRILPESLNIYFAVFISVAEIVLGLLFLLGVYVRETGILLIFLNLVFIFAMATAMARGIDTSCGCFSPEGETLGVKDILRDVFFILLIFVVIGGSNGKDG